LSEPDDIVAENLIKARPPQLSADIEGSSDDMNNNISDTLNMINSLSD
jgi:hypothetical protein